MHSERVIEGWLEARRTGRRVFFAARRSEAYVGGCELRPLSDEVAELSYWTHPAQRRRGVASRAVALLGGAADELGFRRLRIRTDRDNLASQRVAGRAGFEPAGAERGALLFIRGSPESPPSDRPTAKTPT